MTSSFSEMTEISEERLSRLKQLMPEIFVENKIDFERLKESCGETVDSKGERYQFTWAGRVSSVLIRDNPSLGTLIPNKEKSIDFDQSKNIFIEGDNLEVLKILHNSYQGQIKMIYIDPPYNTGKNFIYEDDFTDNLRNYLLYTEQITEDGIKTQTNTETGGHYHSKWLSMIYPRLFFARELLNDDGIIFVSIDDNEVYNLRKIMNEIFGEDNFVAQLVWNSEGHTDNQFHIKVNHEYILVYVKNEDNTENAIGFVVDPNTRSESNLWKGFAENSITKNGPVNPVSEIILPVGFPCGVDETELPKSKIPPEFMKELKQKKYITKEMTKKHNLEYPIRLDSLSIKNGKLRKECRVMSGWANADKLKTFIENNFHPIKENNGNIVFYLSKNGVIYYKREDRKARNILSVIRNMGTTEQAKSYLQTMGIVYQNQYPKPVELIRYLTRIGASKDDDIVLDFFAGSGTTAEAVLQQNKEDGIKRQFICIQLPEISNEKQTSNKFKNIADMCRHRIVTVIKNLKDDLKQTTENDKTLDLGLKFFSLSKSNFFVWNEKEIKDQKSLVQYIEKSITNNKNTNSLSVYELMLRKGLPLTSCITPIKEGDNTFYKITSDNRIIWCCFDTEIKAGVVEQLKIQKDEKLIVMDSAISDTQKINLIKKLRIETI